MPPDLIPDPPLLRERAIRKRKTFFQAPVQDGDRQIEKLEFRLACADVIFSLPNLRTLRAGKRANRGFDLAEFLRKGIHKTISLLKKMSSRAG